MPIFDQVETYSVYVAQNDLGHYRVITLKLQSEGTARIEFSAVLPEDWLQFVGSTTYLVMTADEFDNVYHLLQTEAPVFFTALNLGGLRVGAVHTELELDAGEPPGEGDEDPQSLEAMIRLARRQSDASAASTPDAPA